MALALLANLVGSFVTGIEPEQELVTDLICIFFTHILPYLHLFTF